jgi:hypothetical protein
MAVDCIHPHRSDDRPCLAGPAGARRKVLLLPLLVATCAGPGVATDQRARYGAMVGRSEAELTQSFGQPTRRENPSVSDKLPPK